MEAPQSNTPSARINWLAVIVGFLLDQLISTLVVGVAAQFDPEPSKAVVLTTTAGVITSGLLVLSTGIGGWLAARLARNEFVLHGVLVGGLGIFALLLIGLFSSEPVTLNQILVQCLAVVVGGIGGWISGRLAARQS